MTKYIDTGLAAQASKDEIENLLHCAKLGLDYAIKRNDPDHIKISQETVDHWQNLLDNFDSLPAVQKGVIDHQKLDWLLNEGY